MQLKKLLSVITAVALLAAVVPFGTFTVSAATYSGSCGDNATWSYDTSTYTLTISGTGNISNYYYYSYGSSPDVTTAPWGSYYKTMKTVVISFGITGIGNYAFEGCTALKNITIPDSVTSIGAYAFEGCTELRSITIPDSITSIGNYALDNTGWYNNQSSGLVYIGKVAYEFKNADLSSVVIKDGTLGIAGGAFHRRTNLVNITIPDSVTSIGAAAFYGCTGLTKVNYTGSITDWCKIDFSDYSSNPLYHAHNLYINNELLVGDLIIPDSVTSIGDYAFIKCTGLTSITIPDSVTSIGSSAFIYCSGLTKVNYTGGITDWCKIAFSNHDSNPLYYAHNLYINNELIGNLIIPDSVTSIGDYAFDHCTGLKSVTIGNSVTSIDDYAFYYCTGLTSVTIGNSVTSIGKYAFYNCSGLTSITIPDSVALIGDYAFYDCKKLKTVYNCGTDEQWNNIIILSNNQPLRSADRSHKYQRIINEECLISAADCTHSKVYYKSCALCGKKSDETFEYGKPLGHDYVNIVDDKLLKSEADYAHAAIYYKICSRCGKISSETFESDIYMPCGANCGFIIKDNILYIHGFGETSNWKTQGSVPWYDYADSITDIVIDEGITNVGNYAFYCLENVKNIKSKNSELDFGKYAINGANSDITVLAENGGNVETYCAENNINYIAPTITPELETVTANSITVKAVEGYEYSKDGTVWQKNNKFTGLSPASEYTIYARYAATADIFDTAGTPLIVTTLKSTVSAPAAPDYQSHTENSITLAPNNLYEYSIDGENWQKSSEFTGLSKNIIYRFYQRVAETETEYASAHSKPLIIAIPDKPVILETGYDSILVKLVEGFEYCLDDFVWQESNAFDKLIDNTEYYVYQRLKDIEGEKIYQLASEYTAATTDNSITHTHTFGDWIYDGQNHWQICADCSEKLDEAAHTASDWIIDAEPTTDKAGEKHKECTVCGCVLEEEEIPRLPAYTPGDINGDGSLNNKDLTRLFQYLSDWEVEVDEAALDVNGDGSVNNKDLTRLFQYLSDWDVEIF